jgi:hypothetical protein
MAASDHLNKDLFHGTGGAIEGGVVNPSDEGALGDGAYATTSLKEAERYAARKANDEGRLFGTVYRVSPKSQSNRDLASDKQSHWTSSAGRFTNYVFPHGLKADEIVSYPINYWATNTDIIDIPDHYF